MILVLQRQCLVFENYYYTLWVPEKFKLREGCFKRCELTTMKVKYGAYITELETEGYKIKESS